MLQHISSLFTVGEHTLRLEKHPIVERPNNAQIFKNGTAAKKLAKTIIIRVAKISETCYFQIWETKGTLFMVVFEINFKLEIKDLEIRKTNSSASA